MKQFPEGKHLKRALPPKSRSIRSLHSSIRSLRSRSLLISSLLIGCLVLSLAVLPGTAGAACSQPKVLVLPTSLHAETLSPDQAAALNDAFSIRLRNANPEIQIMSNQDIGNLLEFERQRLLLGEAGGTGAEYRELIGEKVNAEYISTLQVSAVSSRYIVTASLIDVDLGILVKKTYVEVSAVDELPDAVGTVVGQLGDLVTLISSHEEKYPVPPRDPSLTVSVNPESISTEEGKDRCNITVEVRNCRGEAVEGAKVYFREYTTRGHVQGEKEAENYGLHDYQASVTDSEGIARAVYRLDVSKGKKAGKDRVQILTEARGQKKVSSEAEIDIAGIYLEGTADLTEMAPGQATEITLSLFELDSQAKRTPLEGKSLYLEKFRMSDDVRVIPMGEKDSDGNPLTDSQGKVYLKFIAGKNERLERLRVLFQDVGTGYEDAIDTWVEINVKKDEYSATVRWKESGGWTHTMTGNPSEELAQDYTFTFNSRTGWDRYSGKETTDASFAYEDQQVTVEKGITTWYARGPNGNYDVCIGSGPYTETWVVESDFLGKTRKQPTVNAVVDEQLGTLRVPLNPFQVAIPMSGDVSMAIDLKGAAYRNGVLVKEIAGNSEYGYASEGAFKPLGNGPVSDIPLAYFPSNPQPVSNDPDEWREWMGQRELRIRKSAFDSRFSYFRDPYLADKCLLEKTGKTSYVSSWHYEDDVHYEGSPVFFGILLYWEEMVIDGEFSRDVSIRVVKT